MCFGRKIMEEVDEKSNLCRLPNVAIVGLTTQIGDLAVDANEKHRLQVWIFNIITTLN